jgi:hypothetical protein
MISSRNMISIAFDEPLFLVNVILKPPDRKQCKMSSTSHNKHFKIHRFGKVCFLFFIITDKSTKW